MCIKNSVTINTIQKALQNEPKRELNTYVYMLRGTGAKLHSYSLRLIKKKKI